MIGRFWHQIWRANPVFVLGFGLPSVFFVGTSVPSLLAFGLTVFLVLPLAHVVSWYLEAFVWPILRRYLPILVASLLVTGLEVVLDTVGYRPDARGTWLLRALVVDALVMWPYYGLDGGEETLQTRLLQAVFLATGYILALVALFAIRLALTKAGVSIAETVTGVLFIIAIGKTIVHIPLFRSHRQRKAVEAGGKQ